MQLPIIGAPGPDGPNGGVNARFDHRKHYAVALYTTDGDVHYLAMQFDLERGPDGVVKLDGLKGFDPKAQAMAQVTRLLNCAQLGILFQEGDKIPPTVMGVESPDTEPRAVVLRHVVGFEYVGEWDPALRQPVVYAESREHRAAA